MGKGILITVGFMLAGASYLFLGSEQAVLETKSHQSEYQHLVIARDVARSGFERGVSAIRRDQMGVAQAFEQVQMPDGYYDLTITPRIYGDLDVQVVAHSGAAQDSVRGNVIFTAPFPAAVTLDDQEIDARSTGTYSISGVDRRMPSRGEGGGYREPAYGLMTTAAHAGAISGTMNTTGIVGRGASSEVEEHSLAGGYDEAYFEALYDEARASSSTLISLAAPLATKVSQLESAMRSSGPGNPKIVRVAGDLYVNSGLDFTAPATGYGMLIVEDGDFSVSSDKFNWEGIVMVRKQVEDTVAVSLRNGAEVHGGFVAYDVDGLPTNECVPDFSIPSDQHSLDVHEAYGVRIEVLGAAISYGGQYDVPVTMQIDIGGEIFEPFGDYDKAIDGNVNRSDYFVFEPGEVFSPGSVRINARSWLRNSGTAGTNESDWYTYMTKSSTDVDSRLAVLKDNSSKPTVPGFLDQESVEEFVAPYVAGNVMSMDDNQAIFLFELGGYDTSSPAFDMQDLVVIVTLIDGTQAGCVVQPGTSRLEFTMGDGAQVHYSSEAIAKLGLLLDGIDTQNRVAVTKTSHQARRAREKIRYATSTTPDNTEEEVTEEQTPPAHEKVTICFKGQVREVHQKLLAKFVSKGAFVGSCPTGSYGDDDD